ncbi:MAG: MerR family transcriptional regulator [Bacillota bacterium]|jgi:DNA-binding transcriptional MerR regulator
MKEQLYTIGEISRLSGISISTLRYYDKIGLIRPEKVNEKTGYRYYAEGILVKLSVLCSMKELGFSLKEIKRLLPRESVGDLERMVREKLDHLTEKAAAISSSVFVLNYFLTLFDEARTALSGGGERFSVHYYLRRDVSPAEGLPVVLGVNRVIFWCGEIGDEKSPDTYRYCLGDIRELASPVPGNQGVYCISCYHQGPPEEIGATIDAAVRWAESHAFRVTGKVFGRKILDESCVDDPRCWLSKIYLPLLADGEETE